MSEEEFTWVTVFISPVKKINENEVRWITPLDVERSVRYIRHVVLCI